MTIATASRAEGITGYREYLIERDGEADLLNRRLSKREEFFTGIESIEIVSDLPIDREVSFGICVAANQNPDCPSRCTGCSPPPS